MAELAANTTDAAREKHVPVGVRTGDKLKVAVGSVPHPMIPEHHIAWILVADGDRTTTVQLSADGVAEAEFTVGANPVTVYEFCNLHGLWSATL
jgi:superoxide reductase